MSETQNGSTTAWINMQDGATIGFVAVKGDASYAQVKVGDTTLLLLSDGIYQDGEHTDAMYCDVYCIGEDGTPVQTGKLLSEGTTYPICVRAAGDRVWKVPRRSICRHGRNTEKMRSR